MAVDRESGVDIEPRVDELRGVNGLVGVVRRSSECLVVEF